MPKAGEDDGNAAGSAGKSPRKHGGSAGIGGGLAGIGDKFRPNENAFASIGENLGITLCLERSGKAFKSVGDLSARSADRALIANAKIILRSVGTKMNAMMHDDAMPVKLHRGIDFVFGAIWPEIQKGVLDNLLLEKGFQFKQYRSNLKVSSASAPSTPFKWLTATLIYSVMPYDQTFWSMIRSPLFLAFKLVRAPRSLSRAFRRLLRRWPPPIASPPPAPPRARASPSHTHPARA